MAQRHHKFDASTGSTSESSPIADAAREAERQRDRDVQRLRNDCFTATMQVHEHKQQIGRLEKRAKEATKVKAKLRAEVSDKAAQLQRISYSNYEESVRVRTEAIHQQKFLWSQITKGDAKIAKHKAKHRHLKEAMVKLAEHLRQVLAGDTRGSIEGQNAAAGEVTPVKAESPDELLLHIKQEQ